MQPHAGIKSGGIGDAVSAQAARRLRLLPWRMIFWENVSAPDQVRGGLFADHALSHPERFGGVKIPRASRQADIPQTPVAERTGVV